ncbi:MAG: helix-turn-helix domain-containing protein [Planctomycetota bacterium]
MGKMEQTLRSEIQRLARKEIRSELASLTKEIKALKREVARLRKAGPAESKAKAAPAPVELTASPEEVAKARFSAGLIKKLRKRLDLTQAQMASLMDVSPTTVAFWEQGRNRPTDASKASLVALRKLGRRDIKRMLEAQAAAQ